MIQKLEIPIGQFVPSVAYPGNPSSLFNCAILCEHHNNAPGKYENDIPNPVRVLCTRKGARMGARVFP